VTSPPWELIISGHHPASWAYSESFITPDCVLDRARARAEDLGCTPVLAGTGAALRLLAAASSAKAVVEIGTGTGVSALWLLRGMPVEGVLTTIDIEPEHQRAAREAFAEAEIASNRIRVIAGRALEVLPRLSDRAYDLVFCDGAVAEYPEYVEQALRLLRPGGIVAVNNALLQGRIADPAQRDETTAMMRGLGKDIRDESRLVSALLPTGDGLLLAVLQ
jgi:predicted O-methyltransferase YrrM